MVEKKTYPDRFVFTHPRYECTEYRNTGIFYGANHAPDRVLYRAMCNGKSFDLEARMMEMKIGESKPLMVKGILVVKVKRLN
jgi:hypothetical protein